jgi:uncharacterized cupin superfamily protein
MPSDVHHIAKKRAHEMWNKYKNDAISVRIWTEEKGDYMFIYQEHETIDINNSSKEEFIYTLGIQIEW